jgi:hypothetical protein
MQTFSINIHPLGILEGFKYCQNLIAAYVTPNHPYIYHIKESNWNFRKQVKITFEGYQNNDQERVLHQIMSKQYIPPFKAGNCLQFFASGYEEQDKVTFT